MTQAQGQESGRTGAVERVRFTDALGYFAGGFGLGVLFNIGDPLLTQAVTPSWPPVFFYGVPVLALLWVVLPFARRPFVFSAALFLGLVFGFLGGTLLLLNFYGGIA